MKKIPCLPFVCAGLALAQTPGVFPSYYSAQDSEPTANPDSSFWKGISGVPGHWQFSFLI